ncbi:MAG: hypothetical protein NVSMB45_12200 [Ginsengibacter sp.]
MKRIVIVSIVALSLVASLISCKKIVSAIFSGLEFNVPDVSLSVPIVPFVATSEIQFGSATQNINLDSVVKANTANVFGADIVKTVSIKTVTITISNADDLNNLSNFESARITLTSNNNTNPIDIANVTFPNTNATSFVFTPTDTKELVSYLKGSSLTYTVYGKNRKITTKTLNFVASVRLKVN